MRLTNAAEFEKGLRRAELRLRAGALRLSAVTNRMHTARIGLIVPKRVIPKAHDRNRIKRAVREWFRQVRCELPPLDLVIQVQSRCSVRQCRADLQALANRLTQGVPAPSADEPEQNGGRPANRRMD